MLILVLFVILIGLALIGYGRLLVEIFNFFKIFPNSSLSLSDYSLLGIFVVITLTMAGNFLIPLSDFSGVVTLSIGIALLLFLKNKANSFLIKKGLTSLLLMVFCVVIVMARLESITAFSYKTFKTFFMYDTGLYHMPFLQWIASYPIPIGLGNLYGPLGYNSSWLTFHSAWRLPWIGWNSLPIVEGWIWTLGIWVFGEGLVNRWIEIRLGNRILLIALALIFFVNFNINEFGRAISTDHASNILTLLTVVFFVEFFDSLIQQKQRETQRGILLLIVSSCLAITGKLSMMPVIVLPIVGLFMVARSLSMRRALIISLILGILFFTLWLLRNLLLSGCLVYPVSFTCLDQVSWGVGSERAMIEKRDITAWARLPGSNYLKSLNNYDWLSSWVFRLFDNQTVKFVFILLSSSLLLPILEVFQLKSYQENKKNLVRDSRLMLIVIIITMVLGLLLWFFNGPDPRFSWSFLLLSILPSVTFWLALFNVTKIFDWVANIFQKKPIYYVLVALIVVMFVQHSSQLLDLNAWEKAPDVAFSWKTLSSTGQIIRIPLEADQCWGISLPCTPYFNDQLSLDTIWGHPRFRRSLGINQFWKL